MLGAKSYTKSIMEYRGRFTSRSRTNSVKSGVTFLTLQNAAYIVVHFRRVFVNKARNPSLGILIQYFKATRGISKPESIGKKYSKEIGTRSRPSVTNRSAVQCIAIIVTR